MVAARATGATAVGEGLGVATGEGATSALGPGVGATPLPPSLEPEPEPEPESAPASSEPGMVEGVANASGRVAAPLPVAVDVEDGALEAPSAAASRTELDVPTPGADEVSPANGTVPGSEVQPASNRPSMRQAAGIAVVLVGLRLARMTAPRSCPSTCSSTLGPCDVQQNAATVTVRTRVDHAPSSRRRKRKCPHSVLRIRRDRSEGLESEKTRLLLLLPERQSGARR